MKKTQIQLRREIDRARQHVKLGGIYVHYKDSSHTYEVVDLAVNTEQDTIWVVYTSLYDERLTFLRSIDEWCDDVEKDGKIMRRFTELE